MNAKEITTLLRTEPVTRDRIGEPFPFRNEKRREVTSQWKVGPGSTDPDHPTRGDDGTIVLDLTTYHYASRKAYHSSLRVSIESADGRMSQTTMSFGLNGESVNVHQSSVARFSAKTMREHHAEALQLAKDHAGHCGSVLVQGVAQYLPRVTVA